MNILVTGGAGYIGSHINKELARRGYDTLILDNLVYGHLELIKWGQHVGGDLLDAHGLNAIFASGKIDAVIHLAGYAYVGESMADPKKYYLNNVVGTFNLLNTMLQHGVKRIIFSSSCATYGIPSELPIREDQVQSPVNPYGWSKLMAERMLRDFDSAYGMKHVILRYFNAAGADPDGDIGEWHNPEPHIVPRLIAAACGRLPSFPIFGTDYETRDGTCIRDYVHVTDIARAHTRALDHLIEKHSSDVFNIGIGKGYSVHELIRNVQHVTGNSIATAASPKRPGDPSVLVSSGEKCRRVLGWQPTLSDLHVIIETARNWHLSHEPTMNVSPA